MVQHLVKRQWSVSNFEKEFYDFFIESVPSEELSNDELEFFASIQEKLDWTEAHPTPENRKLGWMDYEEYINWVTALYRKFISKEMTHE
jgi:hypothetical protein